MYTLGTPDPDERNHRRRGRSLAIRMPTTSSLRYIAPMPQGLDAPPPAAPDTKDWTWVLNEVCPECGFDPHRNTGADIPALVTDAVARWAVVLTRPDVLERPSPDRWSPLEYGCHTRDVLDTFAERARLMMTEDDPLFANWDQDEAAVAQRYWAQDPALVSAELAAAGAAAAARFRSVDAAQWRRTGRRSNGSVFTVDSLGRYFGHDVAHHLVDVRG
jgi:hypothetical protein